MLMYWADDDRTKVIALYLESFGNPRKFAARYLSARKPIVALVGGTTAAGRRAAVGHTAGATTSGDAVDALFRQCGVIRVDSLEQLLHVSSLLANQPLPRGGSVAIVSNGGGPGVLAADACATAGIDLATLDDTTSARIRALVPGVASAANPTDLGAGASAAAFARAIEVVGNAAGVDAVIAVHTPVPDAAWRSAPRGVVPALEDVRAAAARVLVSRRLTEHPAGCRLDANDTRHLLDCHGVDVVPTVGAAGVEAVLDAAGWIGYPVALKVADPEIVHKTDIGGVRLDLGDAASVRAACREMGRPGEVDASGVDIQVAAHAGPPAEHLIRLSESAQLLVVGRRGTGSRSHGIVGSVVTAVTRHARCPVVVLPLVS